MGAGDDAGGSAVVGSIRGYEAQHHPNPLRHQLEFHAVGAAAVSERSGPAGGDGVHLHLHQRCAQARAENGAE